MPTESTLTDAVSLAIGIRNALRDEVERARGQRELLRNLDARGLYRSAVLRQSFNCAAAELQAALASTLAGAARAHHLAEASLESFAAVDPQGAAELAAVLREVRALASALRQVDELNLHLGRRAMSCVNGYLETLAPRPSAYDKRGIRLAADGGGTFSVRG